MQNCISSLCSSLSLNTNWGVFNSAIPLIAIGVLFSLGVFLIDYILWSISYAGSTNKYISDGVIHKGKRVL